MTRRSCAADVGQASSLTVPAASGRPHLGNPRNVDVTMCSVMKRASSPWPCGSGPVVVGGVGGSGTRVIAQILTDLGYYLGQELNGPLDNLWFTFLLKRPKWYRRVAQDKARVVQGLRIMELAMGGQPIRSYSDKAFVARAAVEHALSLSNPPAQNGFWPLAQAWKLLVTRPKPPHESRAWGWKEPNSHLYLQQIAEYFPAAKYIHAVRHGLDMAFSGNQQQVENWGWLFGVKPADSPDELRCASLEFWVKANQRAVEIGRRLGAKRFMFLNFDRLCAAPEAGVRQMLDFLEINAGSAKVDELARIPRVPNSARRHRQQNLSQFPPALVQAVRSFGFEVEAEGALPLPR